MGQSADHSSLVGSRAMSTTLTTDKALAAFIKPMTAELADTFKLTVKASAGTQGKGFHLAPLPPSRGKAVFELSQGGQRVTLATHVKISPKDPRLARWLAYTLAPFLAPARKNTVVIYRNVAPEPFARALAKALGDEGFAVKVRDEDGRHDDDRYKRAFVRLNLWFVNYWDKGDKVECELRGVDGGWGDGDGPTSGQFTHKTHKVQVPAAEGEKGAQARMIEWLVKELVPQMGGFPRHAEPQPPAKARPAPAKARPAPAKAKAGGGGRRFVFADGSSHKFWSVSARGATVSVHFGRVGTEGQKKDRSFASPAQAAAALEKLVAEKTGKGYVEA
jgi:predicted DNA-binding WGR domain protein